MVILNFKSVFTFENLKNVSLGGIIFLPPAAWGQEVRCAIGAFFLFTGTTGHCHFSAKSIQAARQFHPGYPAPLEL
jgi:hypothetical protein